LKSSLREQRLGDTEELILSYTKEQYKFLDHLEDNERCLFQGSAGTGKTMLALESAKRSI
jgi:phosphate starvation-inducible protein PhoH